MTADQFTQLIYILKTSFMVLTLLLLVIGILLAIGIPLLRDWLKAIHTNMQMYSIRYCTREAGHANPCNGLPRPDCFDHSAEEDPFAFER